MQQVMRAWIKAMIAILVLEATVIVVTGCEAPTPRVPEQQTEADNRFAKEMEALTDTVVKILGHVHPLRAWCNACVVWSRPSARDSRSISRAIRPSKQPWLRTRYTRFGLCR